MSPLLILIIFIVSYLVIMSEKMNRALAAGIGGVCMLFVGLYDIEAALFHHIDWNTIALLFSMMIIVNICSKTGMFEYTAIYLAQIVNGQGFSLLVVFSLLAAVGSAFLANVTIAMLLVPILFTLTKLLDLPPVPYLISMILACNIGGTATLIGDPPNMMIGQAVKHLTFNAFLVNLTPVVIIVFLFVLLVLAYLYRKELQVAPDKQLLLKTIKPSTYIKKNGALIQSIAVLLCTTVGFVCYPFLHVDLTTIALAGALLLLFLTEPIYDTDDILKEVEWGTLFFFVGLFLLVGGLEEAGFIDELARKIIYVTEGDMKTTSIFILWSTGILSGFIDNIPFVAAMIPIIQEFKEFGMVNIDPLWWSLSLGACLGGNGTLLGSSSNLVIAGLASKEKVQIQFREFLFIGFPIVIFSLLISTIYIYFRYLGDFV
ncbi:ArsB/NhaD family transporter [Cytobacillus spongiae]|uniref:ArsB/NhaD family transporter n=1 Tax=Cytobacillus spongiae TaxID=2901381 RepID=UPI001F21EF81|nr:ArsB/NhaD family transporter [Cytobacillus spongiae]UII55010.1 ArsB/NhaD family transporter [Cytobacillus spongiae]